MSCSITTLGPALDRLRTLFPSRDAYLELWKAHPAFVCEWTADVEAYVDYDVVAVDGGLRSRVDEDTIRADGRQLLADAGRIDSALESLTGPVALLRAPRNLLNQPAPLIPDELVAGWMTRLPQLTDRMVEGVNHYTLVFSDRGARALAEAMSNQAADRSKPATPR